ncbi:AMP-binding protein [Paenibacillus oryzisoli]|uniref:AMP-binding protein n=1 Tax=Paenibacillus oryzisoli TaxID=1850517 RepID=UPI003D276E9B
MITIDRQEFTQHDFYLRMNELTTLSEYKQSEGKLFAICMESPLDILCILQFLKNNSSSVLLLVGQTPYDRAVELAHKANSHYLVYGQWNTIVPIKGHVKLREPALYQYSSGTTGQPKLIARSWSEIDLELKSYNERVSSEDVPIILVPVSHSYGLITGVLAALQRGVQPIIVQNKNPKFAIHLIESNKRSIVYGVPFFYQLFESLSKERLTYYKLISSGAPLNEQLLSRLMLSAVEVWQQYGCTEAGCIALGNQLTSPSDVGVPLSHLQVTIMANSEAESLPMPVDEIVVSTGKSEIFTKDLGYRTESGKLHVLSRMDDLINVSGLKVIPAEVESIIGRLEGVREVVVHKTQHKVWGEAVKALVVADGIQIEAVKVWCIQHLPPYKVPSVIEIVTEIPKLPSGKVSRKLLAEQE